MMAKVRIGLLILAALIAVACKTVSQAGRVQAPTLQALQPSQEPLRETATDYDHGDAYEIIRAIDFALQNNRPDILRDMVQAENVFYSRFEGEGNTIVTRQEFYEALQQRVGNGAACQGYMFVPSMPWMLVWVEGWNPAWVQTDYCDISGCYVPDEPWESSSTGLVFDGESGEWELIGVYNTPSRGNDLIACSQVTSSAITAPENGMGRAGFVDLSCAGAPAQRLVVGEYAQVCTLRDSVFMRNSPSRSADRIGRYAPGSTLEVMYGPICADDWSWWQVRDESGQTGWMSEGGDAIDPYFLCPQP
ncbi:MAG: SH3 domain-containing protein [Anaerolineales bacterium]|nr:SH3 domain-containing protein [Anaerolineales bacterium]